MEGTQTTPEMASFKERLRTTWMAGDFGVIALSLEDGAEEFVQHVGIASGMWVLDVACGTGNSAIPAARAGAEVTGIDIASNLIEQANKRAADAGVEVLFEVGDAEDLPFDDGSFDIVITMFGAMFAPRPEVTAAELTRVCRSGGTIAMANWTPEAFVGQMFKLGAKHVPPPPGMPAPILWGTEDAVRERFSDGISDLQMTRRKIVFHFPFGPAEVVEQFRQYFGPTVVAFSKLDAAGQEALRADLEALWAEHNTASDGTTAVASEYLEVQATKA